MVWIDRCQLTEICQQGRGQPFGRTMSRATVNDAVSDGPGRESQRALGVVECIEQRRSVISGFNGFAPVAIAVPPGNPQGSWSTDELDRNPADVCQTRIVAEQSKLHTRRSGVDGEEPTQAGR
jgi:hypothetical protein